MTGLFRSIRVLVAIAALTIALVVDASPAGRWAERALDPLRFAAARRPASGRIVVVEMDAASIAAIRQWPWSRRHYAAALDRLAAAGAASIAFDVDLSSASDPAADAALAAAMARAGGRIVLPTFAQRAGTHDARSMDTLPLPRLRAHAALASVSVAPDDDGIVRRIPYGTVTSGTPRPSLAAYLGSRSGIADDSFRIAYGLDPATIPRLSFVAVRDGRFDPALVRGRDILIGATAIEMGDRYATPAYGVLPGVVVQALAAETLLAGLPREGSAWPMLALALMAGGAALRLRRLRAALALALSAMVALFAVAIVAQVRAGYWLPLAPGLVLVAIAMLGRAGLHLAGRFDHQRCVDEVTGLPNRRAMIRAAGGEGGERGGGGGGPLGVALFANLEPLLTVLGDAAERDLVLRLVERLRLAAGGAAVFRVSDRLFAFALPVPQPGDDLPARLRALLLQPIEVAGRRVDPAVHIGIAAPGGLLGDRLTAAAHAAEQASETAAFWHDGAIDRVGLERKVSLMGELDQALVDGQIEVHYQPKLALRDDRITGVEALVRWRHPDRGMIRPDLFIPLAEQADRIGPLTRFVLDRATGDLADWQAQGLDLTVAINVSARLVADAAFGDAVRAILAAGRIGAAGLTLEVTESATIDAPERAAAALRGFRDLGCGISMDDYGTGQSTLSYLQRLPLSELKIDRSFVQHAHINRADALMVRSTIDLAHGLGLKVVAEGIEDEACLTFLRDAGCDVAQGYLIARPMPRDELEALLHARRQAA